MSHRITISHSHPNSQSHSQSHSQSQPHSNSHSHSHPQFLFYVYSHSHSYFLSSILPFFLVPWFRFFLSFFLSLSPLDHLKCTYIPRNLFLFLFHLTLLISFLFDSPYHFIILVPTISTTKVEINVLCFRYP